MKNQSLINRYYAALRFSSLAIATCALALAMNSCQDYEYGFTEEEIHATAIQREYNKEFQKEFPVIDPHHTWMYDPVQTFVTDNGSPATRAITEPAIIKDYASVKDSALRINADVVDAILDTWMVETDDNYSNNHITANFEYLALTETTYDIWPVLWGEKFCMDNYIGIYVVENGQFKDLGTLWSDTEENVLMGYEDYTENIKNSTRPVNRDITKGWSDKTLPTMNFTHGDACHNCNGTGKVQCTGTVEWKGYNNYRCNKCDSYYNYNEYNNLGLQHRCTNKVNCTSCNGNGAQTDKVNPQYYLFPHYKVVMPAGTLWGVYLRTHKNQDNQEGRFGYNDGMVTWCSNPQFNSATGQYPCTEDLKSTIAAGTFTFGSVTYCCFEDAPLNKKENGQQIYRSYDHDYNDFMLQITPRPIESTYNSSLVRVMCEDLGGSFDWDFNDIVYDLKFEQGKNDVEKASITITLQAVGGTLPIHMFVQNEDLGELHELFGNQQKNDDGLYIPINVGGNGQTTEEPKVLKKILLEHPIMPKDYDFREIVRDITLTVGKESFSTRAMTRADSQSTSSSETTEVSHTINFPDADGDKAPQCFMTSTGTAWSSELVNIIDTYPLFTGWVADQKNKDWWKTDPNF